MTADFHAETAKTKAEAARSVADAERALGRAQAEAKAEARAAAARLAESKAAAEEAAAEAGKRLKEALASEEALRNRCLAKESDAESLRQLMRSVEAEMEADDHKAVLALSDEQKRTAAMARSLQRETAERAAAMRRDRSAVRQVCQVCQVC
ncbi:hypothetical protein FNF27_05488 [Cafeteria roenbergensis]|uniref:Uncharacterized protein n=1 Tax=Cafeteria roenbergensis TaxID=33653 RepID=A0A5A8E850_CAFRO|nr:hypothetical protein FNF27_05488 [Cafeteria roenbergensis]